MITIWLTTTWFFLVAWIFNLITTYIPTSWSRWVFNSIQRSTSLTSPFFFFFIGKKIYIKKLLEANSNSRTEEQKERKQKQRNINYKERELRKRGRESLDVSPQALAQSNREPEKIASKWSLDISRSSNVRRLRSFQMHHIKHNETKFQM